MVGGVVYNLVGTDLPAGGAQQACSSPCVYQREGEEGRSFCFKPGSLASECLAPHEGEVPSSSLPAYNNSNYEQQGREVELASGLRVYTVGEAGPAVVWNYDMKGFNGGRTRERCDQLAARGFQVILPDYYRGEVVPSCPPADFACWASLVPITVGLYNWTRLEEDWGRVREWAREQGVDRFASVGTCGGSYTTLRLSSLPEIIAGVSIHPSHSVMIPNLGEDEAAILAQVEVPQLMLPTGTDSANVKPGGLNENILTEKGVEITIEPFLTMAHGFLTRGDMEDPEVAAEVARAMDITVDFLKAQFNQ